MSQKLKEFAPKLKSLAKCTHVRKEKWVQENLDEDLLCVLCDCSLNILSGNVKLQPRQKKSLEKHKERLRILADKKIPLKRKKVLIQDGGFLAAILGPIVSALSGLLGVSN